MATPFAVRHQIDARFITVLHLITESTLSKLAPEALNKFISSAPERLLKSFARQLGHLHDSDRARDIVGSWLGAGGRLGNFARLTNAELAGFRHVAPVDPQGALAAIRRSVDELPARKGAPGLRSADDAASTLRSIAYKEEHFRDAAFILAHFHLLQNSKNVNDNICGNFQELFWITLSGTQTDTDGRIAVIDELLAQPSSRLCECGLEALAAMLKCQLFSSSHQFSFGAHPRDFGWIPSTLDEQRDCERPAYPTLLT
jgi:hypothetical protein